jgi:prepilin-type N-terminal cleavage/methylation domain-containing protein
MVRERVRRLDARGFSLAELIVVMAVIGILMTLSVPTFISYWRSSTLRGGAQELVAILNQGRQLAIKENTTVCIRGDQTNPTYGTKIRYVVTDCGATTLCTSGTTTTCIWRGAGTDSDGWTTLSNAVQVQAPASNVTFSYLGAAAGASFYICNPTSTSTRAKVTVANSGRVTITYENTAC